MKERLVLMENEKLYILALCNFIRPDKEKLERLMDGSLDYPYILGQLLYNRAGVIISFHFFLFSSVKICYNESS